MTEEEKIIHCTAALKTADIIFELVQPFKDKLFWGDHRSDAPNPVYQQTIEGLLLEFWGSRPVSIITPWGSYSFAGWYDFTLAEQEERDIWAKLRPLLGARLGLDLYKPEIEIDIDTIHGDLYAIGIKSEEISVPLPEECVYSSYISSDRARKEWLELVTACKAMK